LPEEARRTAGALIGGSGTRIEEKAGDEKPDQVRAEKQAHRPPPDPPSPHHQTLGWEDGRRNVVDLAPEAIRGLVRVKKKNTPPGGHGGVGPREKHGYWTKEKFRL